jgi:hypothetical protein
MGQFTLGLGKQRSRQCEVLLYFSDFATYRARERDSVTKPAMLNAVIAAWPHSTGEVQPDLLDCLRLSGLLGRLCL